MLYFQKSDLKAIQARGGSRKSLQSHLSLRNQSCLLFRS
jgi:hypothetical protein